MEADRIERSEEAEDAYGEEVLNASWLPEMPPATRPESGVTEPSPMATADLQDFLAAVYRYQE